MGKWSKYKEKFGSHREAVAELKTEYMEAASEEKSPKKQLAAELRALYQRKEGLDDATKENGGRIEAISELLVEMMEDVDELKFEYDDIGEFKMDDDIKVSVFDKPLLHKYLKKHRQGVLIIPEVHHARLSSYIKELLETKGDEFKPEEAGIKLWVKSKVKPTKQKGAPNE